MTNFKKILTLLLLLCFVLFVQAQNKAITKSKGDIYVDKAGVMRWKKSNQEAAFFGVNYTVPFAYAYRSVKRMGITPEEAIRQDVYHFSRLGLNAFRVHVWDTEISDSLGNLVNNEHLRLFDFLIAELKKRNIYVLITPIAFWGNGYPEEDEKTGSFSNVYSKDGSVREEKAFLAQENYLKQFFRHKNPYTGLTYKEDQQIIATEINNEPHHSGPKTLTTSYINRMVNAIRSTGFTKPVFYNISESPAYANAIVKSNVQGHSFQWYPTGLVSGHTLHGNYLPNVSKYQMPFDTIPGFKNRAKMVYEFDAADILQPTMYPAMAKSFRAAGFQWATQFAYDPMATAYANTEYQTHYLNLAYTPAKAISLLIAAKAFTTLPLSKNIANDTLFNGFRISYKEALSEMNSDEEFYYSNNTKSKAVNTQKLKHLAGVGSSGTVRYDGTGAYFLDKISEGIWRLEVMPDAAFINDPFAKASPEKTVSRILWNSRKMEIILPDFAEEFSIEAINKGNDYKVKVNNHTFQITPGTYILSNKNEVFTQQNNQYGSIVLNEFVAPKASDISGPILVHHPFTEVSANQNFEILASISGVYEEDEITAEIRNSLGKWKTISMHKIVGDNFKGIVPAEMLSSGILTYRMMIKNTDGETNTFPAKVKGNPYAWDYFHQEAWTVFVMPPDANLELFNPKLDKENLNIYNPDWKNNQINYISGKQSGHLLMQLAVDSLKKGAWQMYIAHKILGRKSEISNFKNVVIKANSLGTQPQLAKIAFINSEGKSFSAEIALNQQQNEIIIPFEQLKASQMLLLPRPYPGFLPLYYKSDSKAKFSLADSEKLEFSIINSSKKPITVLVESIYLK